MAEVIMMCGKICSGKSTFARELRKSRRAAVLSVDEITLALFGADVGDMHDTYVERAENYLYGKSLELIEAGVDVILDWGFWQRQERDYAREFYSSRGIEHRFIYICPSEEEWRRRVDRRNQAVYQGMTSAYLVDEGLAAKASGLFEEPGADEPDVTRVHEDD